MNIDKDFGFIILNPSMNYAGLRATISTIRFNFPEATCLAVVADSVDKKDQAEIERLVPTIIAKSSITALINEGIAKSKQNWNCVVVAGSYVRRQMLRRYTTFITKETDIGYPIADLKSWRFEESSLNGFFIHKKTFHKVGPFAEDERSLEVCRLFSALDAADKGCQLKGLVGVKIC